MFAVECIVGYVLPTVAHFNPATSRTSSTRRGGHGAAATSATCSSCSSSRLGYRVRWSAVRHRAVPRRRAVPLGLPLFAYGTISALALAVLPESFNRPFAVPTGVALIGLGVSLWRDQRHPAEIVDAPATIRVAQAATR